MDRNFKLTFCLACIERASFKLARRLYIQNSKPPIITAIIKKRKKTLNDIFCSNTDFEFGNIFIGT